jgi:hypothetical protein
VWWRRAVRRTLEVKRMKWTPLLLGSFAAALMAGCGGERRNNDTGAVRGTGMEADTGMRATDTTSAAPGAPGLSSDTARTGTRIHSDTNQGGAGMAGGMSSDTSRPGSRIHSDTNRTGAGATGAANPNQTKSGVTDTKTGKSTLGKGVTKTRPDQGQPVTSKGDTVRSGGDSVSSSKQ